MTEETTTLEEKIATKSKENDNKAEKIASKTKENDSKEEKIASKNRLNDGIAEKIASKTKESNSKGEKIANTELTFENGWLQLELVDMEGDMSFLAEYWTYWEDKKHFFCKV